MFTRFSYIFPSDFPCSFTAIQKFLKELSSRALIIEMLMHDEFLAAQNPVSSFLMVHR